MHQRSSLRLLGVAVALAATVAACGGAGSGRPAERASGPAAQTAGSGATGSPGETGTPAASPAAAPSAGASGGPAERQPSATGSISTTEASDLLRQVDDLLKQAAGELAANDDAAINMGE